MKESLWMALLVCGCCSVWGGENLLLSQAGEDGFPKNGAKPKGCTLSVVDQKLNAVMQPNNSVTYTITITPELRSLRIRGKMAAEGVVPGKAEWQNGRISSRFVDKGGKVVAWPDNYQLSGTKQMDCDRVYLVPKEAHAYLVEPANFGTAGTMTYTGLAVEAAPENLLAPPHAGSVPAAGIEQKNVRAFWQDGNLSVTVDGQGGMTRMLRVLPEWKALRLSFEVKCTDVVRGDAEWKNARISCRFLDAKHKGAGAWPNNFQFTGTQDWTKCSRVYQIPANAAFLQMDPGNFGQSGKVEFRNLSVAIVK